MLALALPDQTVTTIIVLPFAFLILLTIASIVGHRRDRRNGQ